MKQCNKCGLDKEEVDFPGYRKGRICKECVAARQKLYLVGYYQKHKQPTKDRIKKYRASLKREMYDFLACHPCLDCGETDIVVLQFDHLGDKDGEVSKHAHNTKGAAMRREMAKCEVVCSNCHIRREAKRGGWEKLDYC